MREERDRLARQVAALCAALETAEAHIATLIAPINAPVEDAAARSILSATLDRVRCALSSEGGHNYVPPVQAREAKLREALGDLLASGVVLALARAALADDGGK